MTAVLAALSLLVRCAVLPPRVVVVAVSTCTPRRAAPRRGNTHARRASCAPRARTRAWHGDSAGRKLEPKRGRENKVKIWTHFRGENRETHSPSRVLGGHVLRPFSGLKKWPPKSKDFQNGRRGSTAHMTLRVRRSYTGWPRQHAIVDSRLTLKRKRGRCFCCCCSGCFCFLKFTCFVNPLSAHFNRSGSPVARAAVSSVAQDSLVAVGSNKLSCLALSAQRDHWCSFHHQEEVWRTPHEGAATPTSEELPRSSSGYRPPAQTRREAKALTAAT